MKSLGLRSRVIHGATRLEATLSQPRAVLVTLRRRFQDVADDDGVELCDSGIKTLTNLIGDNFKPK